LTNRPHHLTYRKITGCICSFHRLVSCWGCQVSAVGYVSMSISHSRVRLTRGVSSSRSTLSRASQIRSRIRAAVSIRTTATATVTSAVVSMVSFSSGKDQAIRGCRCSGRQNIRRSDTSGRCDAQLGTRNRCPDSGFLPVARLVLSYRG